MNKILQSVAYSTAMIRWALILHVKKWSRYKTDVIFWLATIWLTIAAQGLFILTIFQTSDGQFFNYSLDDVLVFFGIILISTGLAQIVIHGYILRLSNAVWRGDFDYWLLQPPSIFFRVLLEEVGLIWFWPHLVIGVLIIFSVLSISQAFNCLLIAMLSALIEIGILISVCVPTIKWGKWNPEQGFWEYMEQSRSIPVLRSKNILLILISSGVLHYSIAIEVFTGNLPVAFLILLAGGALFIAHQISSYFLRLYSSASS